MGNGFQFIDIILFAMVAAFLIFRLRNVLGRRDGHESKPEDRSKPIIEHDDNLKDEDDNIVQLSEMSKDVQGDVIDQSATGAKEASPLDEGLINIQQADPDFGAKSFTEGASMAFEMILNAYAAGDTAVLKNLLSSDVYSNFSQAIRDREQAGEILEDTLVDIKSADIVEAYFESHHATVTVKFLSEQVNAIRDENGDVVDGNPNAIIMVTDFWTFSRDTRSKDPNWTLIATRSLD